MKLKMCPACMEQSWAWQEWPVPLCSNSHWVTFQKDLKKKNSLIQIWPNKKSFHGGHKGWAQIHVSGRWPFSLLASILALPEYLCWRRHHISLPPCARRGQSRSSHSVTAHIVVWGAVTVLVLSAGAGEVTCPSQERFGSGRSIVHKKEAVWAQGIPRENACLCRMVISVFTYASHPTAVLSVGNVLPFPSRWTWLPLWVGSESCILLAALLSLTGCSGARISLGKPEMAARQVSCRFPCSSFLLLAEQNLIFFLAIIMGCEEQLLN